MKESALTPSHKGIPATYRDPRFGKAGVAARAEVTVIEQSRHTVVLKVEGMLVVLNYGTPDNLWKIFEHGT